jgi:hypothetical protein
MTDMALFYLLNDDHSVRPTDDGVAWAKLFESPKQRIVARTELPGCHVSTVFTGLDHRFAGSGPPLLFETMIFGGALNDAQWRYSSWDDAEIGHAAAVRKVKEVPTK